MRALSPTPTATSGSSSQALRAERATRRCSTAQARSPGVREAQSPVALFTSAAIPAAIQRRPGMSGGDEVQRAVLPIPDRPYAGTVVYDAKDPDANFAPISPVRPPSGAPNVLVVLLDDVGVGASSAFGGPVSTPTAERLAGDGLKYTRFHTTVLCSPTRAALISGRNHHAVGMGGITELATAAPGYTSVRPNTCAPLPETLRLNGYATAHFGKCHEVPVWETSPAGPFDRWPSAGTGASYTPTAIACSARCMTPRMRCRSRCSRPGGACLASRVAARCARGCTGSRPT